jgi:hypothetical protein
VFEPPFGNPGKESGCRCAANRDETETKTAVDEKYLYEGEHGPCLRDDHPKVKKALAALRELRDFMDRVDSDSDSAFREDY